MSDDLPAEGTGTLSQGHPFRDAPCSGSGTMPHQLPASGAEPFGLGAGGPGPDDLLPRNGTGADAARADAARADAARADAARADAARADARGTDTAGRADTARSGATEVSPTAPAPARTGPARSRQLFGTGLRRLGIGVALGGAIVWCTGAADRLPDARAVMAAMSDIAPLQWIAAAVFAAASYAAAAEFERIVHRILRTGVSPARARRAGFCATALGQAVGMGPVTGAIVRWTLLPGTGFGLAARVSAAVAASFLAVWAVVAAAAVASAPQGPVTAWGTAAALVLAALGIVALAVGAATRIARRGRPGRPAGALAGAIGRAAAGAVAAIAGGLRTAGLAAAAIRGPRPGGQHRNGDGADASPSPRGPGAAHRAQPSPSCPAPAPATAPATARDQVLLLAFGAADMLALAAAFAALVGPAAAPAEVLAPFLLALGAGLVTATPAGIGGFDAALLTLLPGTDAADIVAAIVAFRVVCMIVPALAAITVVLRAGLSPAADRSRDAKPQGYLPPAEAARLLAEAVGPAEALLIRQGHLGAVLTRDAFWPAAPAGPTLTAIAATARCKGPCADAGTLPRATSPVPPDPAPRSAERNSERASRPGTRPSVGEPADGTAVLRVLRPQSPAAGVGDMPRAGWGGGPGSGLGSCSGSEVGTATRLSRRIWPRGHGLEGGRYAPPTPHAAGRPVPARAPRRASVRAAFMPAVRAPSRVARAVTRAVTRAFARAFGRAFGRMLRACGRLAGVRPARKVTGREAALIAALSDAARATGRIPVLYKATPRAAASARRAGFRVLAIAAEAIVRPADFAPESPACAGLRRKLRKAHRSGVRVAAHLPCGSPALPLGELADVNRDWAAAHGGERGFSTGRFAPGYVAGQGVWMATGPDGRIAAFATFHLGAGEWTLDLMRQRPGAPDGTMHSLVAAAIADAAAARVARLSLAAAPADPDRVRGRVARAYARLARRYGGAGLVQFKAMFDPSWEPRYLAAPRAAGLVRAGIALARAIRRPDPLDPRAATDTTADPALAAAGQPSPSDLSGQGIVRVA